MMRLQTVRRAALITSAVALIGGVMVGPLTMAGAQVGPSVVASIAYSPVQYGGAPDFLWVNGAPGTYHIDAYFDGDGTPDWSANGPPEGGLGFNLGAGVLIPGVSHVTVTGTQGDPWQKVLDVVGVRVEYASSATEEVGGVAPPGSTVAVTVWPTAGGPSVYSGTTTANGFGYWGVDLATATPPLDLTDAHAVNAAVFDTDGDSTTNGAEVTVPVVHAWAGGGSGEGYLLLNAWPDGMRVTVEVDYENDGIVDDTFQTAAYRFGPGIDLGTQGFSATLDVGDRVVVSADDGLDGYRWAKELIVEAITVDGVDLSNDTTWGLGPPTRQVTVSVNPVAGGLPLATIETSTNAAGNWTVDFDIDIDFQNNGVGARVTDPDGDSSNARFAPSSEVTMNASPTVGLWDGRPIHVDAFGLTPGTNAFVSVNETSQPTTNYMFLPSMPVGGDGHGSTDFQVPRFLNGFDCASAPGACVLVVADQPDPYNRNAVVPLTFATIDLYRYVPDYPADPWAGGQPGAQIAPNDLIDPGDLIWVAGSGFEPGAFAQLNQCRNFFGTEFCRNSMANVVADEDGAFGVPIQVGKNVFGEWGVTPQLTIEPRWDVRDGQTVMMYATGLPVTQFDGTDCDPGACYIGARVQWDTQTSQVQSQGMNLGTDAVPVTVTVNEALQQQMEEYVHINPGDMPVLSVPWNGDDGTLEWGYTVSRWVTPNEAEAPYSPPPVEEGGAYDCAVSLEPEAGFGATEPVHCSMVVGVVEGGQYVFADWQSLHFARFDLTAAINASGTVTSKPAGATIRGEVTCTGFMQEQYPVNIEGTLTQGAVVGSFATTVLCSGTMTNPHKAFWSVTVPGLFHGGAATVTIDVSSAGFTRTEYPLHVEAEVALSGSGKGGKKPR